MGSVIVASLLIPLTILGIELIWRLMRPPKIWITQASLYPTATRSYRYPIVFIEQAFFLASTWIVLGIIFLIILWEPEQELAIELSGLVAVTGLTIFALARRFW